MICFGKMRRGYKDSAMVYIGGGGVCVCLSKYFLHTKIIIEIESFCCGCLCITTSVVVVDVIKGYRGILKGS